MQTVNEEWWCGGGGGGSGEVVYRGETSKQRKGTFQGCVVKFPSSLLHLPFDNLFSFLWTPLFVAAVHPFLRKQTVDVTIFNFPASWTATFHHQGLTLSVLFFCGIWTCPQMLMHAIAHGVCTNTVRESVLESTVGEKSLATRGNQTCISTMPDPLLNQLSCIPALE